MVKDTTPSWCVMCECDLEPLLFNWFRAAVRLYNVLTQSNSSNARKILLLDLPRDIIRSVARFRLRAHTLRIETVTWTHNTSPTCDFVQC